ncbi:hypothetical protein MdSGHV037 [Musca domestica salivary gland hypertrophy virus]|uniref:Uncharacterized protein n=1 Tax=Musca hytrovirus(isolate Musca domestica/United States/Boucias/-) TaxID=523909 RepID=B2YG14_MHVB|nr:hypothetical protein MdSGHV037 [Musca domestica salivary gland hypertrophy virus]ACD03496.1 hypothetical protein MdSGHV037 [Musca domestica salivary gland hypertrophy virus]
MMKSKYIIVALVVALCSCVVLGQNETDASPESQLESPPLQSESPSQLLESLPQEASSPAPQEPQEAPSQAPSSPAPQEPSSVQEPSPAPQEPPSPPPQEAPSQAPPSPSQEPSPAPPAPHEPAPVLAENHVVAYNEPNPVNELLHFSLPPQPKWEPANHIANLNAESAQLNESSAKDDKGDKEQPSLVKLCMDFLHDNETCHHLYSLCNNEQYLRLTWEVTYRVFFERPFGIVLFVVWTVILCILNFVILFLCTLLKPLRSILLTKIVSDLRRRYYFTNDASELRVVDSNNIKK